jgi:cytochrome c oxidase subunit 2
MKEIFLVAIVIMIFLVIFQIAKASEYVSVLKGEEKTRKQNNKINGFLLVHSLYWDCWVPGIVMNCIMVKRLFPQGSGSLEGEKIDQHALHHHRCYRCSICNYTGTCCSGLHLNTRKRKAEKHYYFPHNKLELLWTTVPAIFLTVLVVFGLKYWFKITGDAPKDAMVVEITGHQFAWEMRYPGKDGVLGKKNYKLYNKPSGNTLGVDFEDPESRDDLHTNEMHLPVGKPVKLVIHAQDVIHDVGCLISV